MYLIVYDNAIHTYGNYTYNGGSIKQLRHPFNPFDPESSNFVQTMLFLLEKVLNRDPKRRDRNQ